MSAVIGAPRPHVQRNGRQEPLQNGDRLTAPEFMRRYEAMPNLKKAELIEGIVYMSPPFSFDSHSVPDSLVQCWLTTYSIETPGTQVGGNGTVRLDLDNVPQPDVALRLTEECGGTSRLDEKGYIVGPPELVVEIAASSSSMDLHDKLRAYRRNGVKEYLVWRTTENELDWFVLAEGNFERHEPDARGLCQSVTFAGLVLNVPALLDRKGAAVLATLNASIRSKAHKAFVAELAARGAKSRKRRSY